MSSPEGATDDRDLGAFIPAALDDAHLDPYEFRVYARIVRRAGRGECWETQAHMAEACRMSQRKVREALTRLLDRRMLAPDEPDPEARSKRGVNVVYRLTPQSEWVTPAHSADTPAHSAAPPRHEMPGTPAHGADRRYSHEGTPPEGASGGEAGSTQTLLAEYIDACNQPPPGRVKGQLAKEIKSLLDEGYQPEQVRPALMRVRAKGLHPSTLASALNETLNASPGGGDQWRNGRPPVKYVGDFSHVQGWETFTP